MSYDYYGGGGGGAGASVGGTRGGNMEPTKMDDYGYGTDHLDSKDPYSFGAIPAQQPVPGGVAGVPGSTQQYPAPVDDQFKKKPGGFTG